MCSAAAESALFSGGQAHAHGHLNRPNGPLSLYILLPRYGSNVSMEVANVRQTTDETFKIHADDRTNNKYVVSRVMERLASCRNRLFFLWRSDKDRISPQQKQAMDLRVNAVLRAGGGVPDGTPLPAVLAGAAEVGVLRFLAGSDMAGSSHKAATKAARQASSGRRKPRPPTPDRSPPPQFQLPSSQDTLEVEQAREEPRRDADGPPAHQSPSPEPARKTRTPTKRALALSLSLSLSPAPRPGPNKQKKAPTPAPAQAAAARQPPARRVIRCRGVKTMAQSKALCAHNPTDRAGTALADYDYDVVVDSNSTATCPACLIACGGKALPSDAPFIPFTDGLPGADKQSHKRDYKKATGEDMPTGSVGVDAAATGAVSNPTHPEVVFTHTGVGTSSRDWRPHAQALGSVTTTYIAELGFCFYLCAKKILGMNSIGAVVTDMVAFTEEIKHTHGKSRDSAKKRLCSDVVALKQQLAHVQRWVDDQQDTHDDLKYLPLEGHGGTPGGHFYLASRLHEKQPGSSLVVLAGKRGHVDVRDCSLYVASAPEHYNGRTLKYDSGRWLLTSNKRRSKRAGVEVDMKSSNVHCLLWTNGNHFQPAAVV